MVDHPESTRGILVIVRETAGIKELNNGRSWRRLHPYQGRQSVPVYSHHDLQYPKRN